jgi:hypothetical protein
MPTWTRLCWSALILFACLGCVGYAWPEWLRGSGLDWQAVADARRETEAQERRSEDLGQRQEVTRRRIEAKQAVTRQLVDGRLTLLEAAAWFRYLNENPSDCQDPYRYTWPGDSDGEKLCRQVIGWAEVEVRERSSPSQADEKTRLLEAELGGHLARDGTVRLPALGEEGEARE